MTTETVSFLSCCYGTCKGFFIAEPNTTVGLLVEFAFFRTAPESVGAPDCDVVTYLNIINFREFANNF